MLGLWVGLNNPQGRPRDRVGDEDGSLICSGDFNSKFILIPFGYLIAQKQKDVGSPKKPYGTGVLMQCLELSPCLVCCVTHLL